MLYNIAVAIYLGVSGHKVLFFIGTVRGTVTVYSGVTAVANLWESEQKFYLYNQ